MPSSTGFTYLPTDSINPFDYNRLFTSISRFQKIETCSLIDSSDFAVLYRLSLQCNRTS